MRSFRSVLVAVTAVVALGSTSPASAQLIVEDPVAIGHLITQASNGAQQIAHALTQIQQLQAQLSNQALMLQKMQTDITGPIAQITSQATQILQQAQGIGYGASNVVDQFKSLYPSSMAGATLAGTQASLASWRAQNGLTLQQALQMQNQIAQGQPMTASQVAAAVQASQAAPGQTAAIQATNQLLATMTGQLTQLQNLLITQARAEQTLAAQMQASQAAGAADSQRFWSVSQPASRVQNPGSL
ncbi:MAG: conjugal transfer protein TrbJ [Caulobacterales bacterium]|nr:conjugal transfer protein TrbJ [Caulobacterales bacterium]